MIKNLVHDPIFLAQKSESADIHDVETARDLLDTITAHKDSCVGMAANMIGVRKRLIVFDGGGEFIVMFNPEILAKSGAFDTAEGCLSLLGDPRPVKRFKTVKVRFQNEKFQTFVKTYTGFAAQIIQHEIDHCDGILI